MSGLYKGLGEFYGRGSSLYANGIRSGEVFVAQVLGLIKESSDVLDQSPAAVGAIRINKASQRITPENEVTMIAEPLDRNHYRLPLIGEQVLVTDQNGRYYYFAVVTSAISMLSNIDPTLMINAAQSTGQTGLGLFLSDTDAELKRFESRLDISTKLLESKTQLPSRVREGDTILEGRLGGVIKFTQTITKDGVWNKEKQITNIGTNTFDGDPMLIMKSSRRSKSYEDLDIVNPPMEGLEDDDINEENSSVYLTTHQNIPMKLASSQKFYSWTVDVLAKGASILDDPATAVLSSLIPDAYDPEEELQINLENVSMAYTYKGDGGGAIPAQIITKDIKDFNVVVATVIDKLEGGYWHPAMYLNGRLKPDNYYQKSGETMMGIDRYAGAGLRDTAAGKQFWSLIDNAVPPAGTPWIRPGAEYQSINLASLSGAAQTWKWGYRGGPLEAQLRALAGEMIYPSYVRNTKSYMDPATATLVQSDGRLMFHFVYACWNGPGWFQKFANDMDKAVKSGITDTNQLCIVAMNSRLKEGYEVGSKPNKLIAQGGRKICGLIGVPVPA